jgi:type I restriction enzyme S subunit
MVGSTQVHIANSAFKSAEIPLPNTKEQEAIAEALSDADALIESLEQLLVKKREVKQGAMQELLTGKSRLAGFHSQWKSERLKELLQIAVTDGPHLTPKFLADGIPFLSVNNLIDNKIDLAELRFISKADDEVFAKKCKPKMGDLLLGKAASVGKVALVDIDIDFNIWSPIALIRVNSQNCARYVYYSFQSKYITRQIELLTNSSSQGNIGMSDIEQLIFKMPTLAEQKSIASLLFDMDAAIIELETKLAKARQIKQAMMQELLTGRIRLM